ncbi:hypothetical protein HBB16_15380 [Pseudonocardia sp. MCCB 268]|nr:hypothetical protein [Pseudonocardia cytotoxica]
MKRNLEDLDGVFTYLVVTEDSLSMAKDEIAAKPLVLHQTDNLVALASPRERHRAVLHQEIDSLRPLREGGAGVVAVNETSRPVRYDDARARPTPKPRITPDRRGLRGDRRWPT